jgi:hypothetical protein
LTAADIEQVNFAARRSVLVDSANDVDAVVLVAG